jgi:hypothetical protein
MSQKIVNVARLFVLLSFTIALAKAQTPKANKAIADIPLQLDFVGKETRKGNGGPLVRFKLSVTNRSEFPNVLWQPSPHLPPCGKNDNASRTWVEIFGSPGDIRLGGFCGLRSSEDLGHLWFAAQPELKGPPCVYLVMTDRQTGVKYISNPVCSRTFTLITDSRSASRKGEHERWLELHSWGGVPEPSPGSSQVTGPSDPRQPKANRNRPIADLTSVAIDPGDSSAPANKTTKTRLPDLLIRQFLFPPTNDTALRVHVVNRGETGSAACRLVLTVRKINGTAVGRQTHVNVSALAAGADEWLFIDAKNILPNNIALASTTFKLNVDATEIVSEADESNNEVWHPVNKRRE